MAKPSSPMSLSSFIVSLRDFTRNPSVRRRALKQTRPVIIEQAREQEYFILLPPALYDAFYNLYRDMRDSNNLHKAIKEKTEWHDLTDIKKETDDLPSS